MSEVLVVIDHADGEVKKPTYELLTLAKRLGEPSAVFIGEAGKGAEVAEKVKKYGAEKVYVVADDEIKGYLVAPKAEALQQLMEQASPAAVLIPSTFEGKEVAARLAIKTGSGLITDAVDVAEDGTTTQSVFAGNFTVTAKVTTGTPIITVKPNSAAPEESEGAGTVEEFSATISDDAKKAQIVASQPRKATGRPELRMRVTRSSIGAPSSTSSSAASAAVASVAAVASSSRRTSVPRSTLPIGSAPASSAPRTPGAKRPSASTELARSTGSSSTSSTARRHRTGPPGSSSSSAGVGRRPSTVFATVRTSTGASNDASSSAVRLPSVPTSIRRGRLGRFRVAIRCR